MLEFVLGALVVIGVFVFWCDVTNSWNNVFPRNKDWKKLIRALLPPYSKQPTTPALPRVGDKSLNVRDTSLFL
jgi:hypothetical protein